MHELKLMDVQKKYKDKEAVRKFNYTFTNGVYGLLGENGAGKTTLMRLICGVLQPTGGSIYCDKIEIASMGAEYRRLLGYLPQDFGYYGDFTAERFLRYMAALKALPEDYADSRIDELLDMVELKNVKKKKLKTFSGGMIRRIGIAQALLNNPEILITDAPPASGRRNTHTRRCPDTGCCRRRSPWDGAGNRHTPPWGCRRKETFPRWEPYS